MRARGRLPVGSRAVPVWLALLGLLPPLAFMLLVDRLDAMRPEPPRTLRRTTLAGAIAFFPCGFLEVALDSLGPRDPLAHGLFRAFVVVAAVEELAKLFCLRFYVWNKIEFDERLDGLVYAMRAALGLTLVENVFYLFALGSVRSFVAALVMRALLTVPIHMISAGLLGYCATRRKFDGKGPGLWGGYLIAVAVHGVFDAALFAAPVALDLQRPLIADLLVGVPVVEVIVGGFVTWVLAKRALSRDDVASRARR
jgi:RsiW-degrading membrane proteinase PrsW (M82 family)